MGIFGANFWSLAWVGDFLRWCGDGVEDSISKHPSVKRIGLIMTVTFLVGFMAGLGAAIGYMVYRHITPVTAPGVIGQLLSSVEVLAGMTLTAVTTGYLGGKKIERTPPPKEASDAATP